MKLLFQLLEEAGRHDLVDAVLDFLQTLRPAPTDGCAMHSNGENAEVIDQTLTDVLLHVKDMPLHEVCTYVVYTLRMNMYAKVLEH